MELSTAAKKAGEKYSKLNSPLLKPNDTSSDEIRPYALSVLDKEGPKRPKAPSHEGVGEHKKQCDDWCRPNVFGHEWHWSEILLFLIIIALVTLSIIQNFGGEEAKTTQAPVFWILVIVSCFLGNIFLWNIGWIESDAAYSRQIAWACNDIEKENEAMKGEVKSLLSNVKKQADLATKASQQTVAMGKKVGVINASGKLMADNVKKFENLMDSPAFTNYQVRFSRSNKIQKEVNMVNKRDNFYNDVIRTFQTAAQGGDESFIDINDKRIMKRLEKGFKDYNKTCNKMGSLPLDTGKFKEMDVDKDGKIQLWEFCVAIYHNVLRRKLGSEVHKVKEMEDECEKMKKRISQINAIIAQHKQGTEVEMEELDDFEINTECMAFSKQDTHEK